jgi:hypothetical protein
MREVFASKLRMAYEKKEHSEAGGAGFDCGTGAFHDCPRSGPAVPFLRLPRQQVQDGTLLWSNYSQRYIAQEMTLAGERRIISGLLEEKMCQAGRLGARLPPLAWQVSWVNGSSVSICSN